MEVYFQLITDAETLAKACEDLQKEDFLGFDTETTALDPYDGNLRLVQLSNGKDTKVIDLKPFGERGDLRTSAELTPLRDLLSAPKPIKIAHNAKFDAKWILHHLNVELGGTFDTLLASQIIAAGDQDRRHSLADVTSHFLNTELDKSEQVSDWSAAELSQSQIEYAARDAATMIPLREKIVERLRADALVKVAKLEFDCVLPIAAMELNGFYLDAKCWREQLDKVKIAQGKVAMELQQMLSAGVAQASLFGVTEINLDSQNQVTDALKNLGVPVPETTRGWQLQPLAQKYPVVAKLLEYRGVAKNLTSFGENILEFINPQTGRLHADFRQIGAPTGRFSCVAEGTLIDVPGGRIPVEKIEKGDLVYCYKDNGEPTVRRVLNVFDNGVRDCVEIKWQSSGDRSTGSLVVTPDHKIRTKYKGWTDAQNLKRYDKLFHLRKAVIKREGKDFRARLYGTNRYMELEEQFLKREHFRAESSMHIHHKNENKTDNRIENLEILSSSEHASRHASAPARIAASRLNILKALANRPPSKYGEENHLWKSVSRFGLIKMLAKAKGRPTFVEMDFETFKHKCRQTDLSIKAVASRYGTNGIYLTDKKILAALAESRNTCVAAERLGIGTRRLKAVCQERGLAYNHAVTSVRKVGKRRVFDLEVEGEHNFIANEICVHNCSKPNIQQIPHDENYRHCFRAPEGRKLIIADYSQVELRILAEFSKDENFIKAFISGADFHTITAAQVFNVKPEDVTSDQRSFAKRLNFGVVYGIGSQRFALMTGLSQNNAEDIMRKYFATYRGLDSWLREAARKVTTERAARTASGRLSRFRFDPEDRKAASLAQRNGKNMPIQGTSADVLKRALHLLHKEISGTSARLVNIVHDEIIVEAAADEAQMTADKLEKAMCAAGEEYI
ncbi:MAG: HNH endonuclease, partial [Pyrinomonadaceae bacterium]|nr:HNH endonuclease [Pyrinomonadaceae bacterium]